MGGSGSNTNWPVSGAGGSSGSEPCNIHFQTNLFSPIAAVVASLNVGNALDIELYTQGQSTSVAALTVNSKQVAGTLAGARQLGDLVVCLRQGHKYQGEIVSIAGSTITINVTKV